MKVTKPRTLRSVAYNFGEEQVQFLDPHAYFASESIDNMAHTSQLSALSEKVDLAHEVVTVPYSPSDIVIWAT
jgi:hypothetical protein